MTKIGIVTGAAGGIGKAYVRRMMQEDLDEIWCMDRTLDLLKGFKEEFGEKAVTIGADFSSYEDLTGLKSMIQERKPEILYLVNCAGTVQFQSTADACFDELHRTMMVNCEAPVLLTAICIPFMPKGSHILNMSSIGAFTPLPYINLYCAAKAFLRYYSRALNAELQERGIVVTAVCPGWVNTDMLPHTINGHEMKYEGMSNPEDVVAQAMKDAKAGRDMSVHTWLVKTRHVICKIIPQKWAIKAWRKKIRRYF